MNVKRGIKNAPGSVIWSIFCYVIKESGDYQLEISNYQSLIF